MSALGTPKTADPSGLRLTLMMGRLEFGRGGVVVECQSDAVDALANQLSLVERNLGRDSGPAVPAGERAALGGSWRLWAANSAVAVNLGPRRNLHVKPACGGTFANDMHAIAFSRYGRRIDPLSNELMCIGQNISRLFGRVWPFRINAHTQHLRPSSEASSLPVVPGTGPARKNHKPPSSNKLS